MKTNNASKYYQEEFINSAKHLVNQLQEGGMKRGRNIRDNRETKKSKKMVIGGIPTFISYNDPFQIRDLISCVGIVTTISNPRSLQNHGIVGLHFVTPELVNLQTHSLNLQGQEKLNTFIGLVNENNNSENNILKTYIYANQKRWRDMRDPFARDTDFPLKSHEAADTATDLITKYFKGMDFSNSIEYKGITSTEVSDDDILWY